MGSGGSAGKEAGPLKALLRQQTQSALEQRVRQYIHMCLYIYYQVYAQKTGDYENYVSPLCRSLTGL